MSTNLVRRNKRTTMMTKELKKRTKFSLVEKYKALAPIFNTFLGFFILSGIIFALCYTSSIITILLYSLGIVASILFTGANVVLWVDISDSSTNSFTERFNQLSLDDLRRNRAHKDDELGRLPELDNLYSRYCILVSRQKNEIVISAVEHTHKKYRFWSGFFAWKATVTKKLWDAEKGRWGEKDTMNWKISSPTVDKVREALTTAQVIVEELENKSYAEALERYRLDVLAIAMQPPPASSASVAAVSIQEDTLEELLTLEGNNAAEV
jgi:hypothetical protein